MLGLGDCIVLILSIVAFLYGLYLLLSKKLPLYFQMIIGAIGCHILGYLFNVCEYFVADGLSDGYIIQYFGSISCFLFFLTASYGYMDGVMDDRTPQMRKSRILALLAPMVLTLLVALKFLSDSSLKTKILYVILWIPASLSSYFHLKHALIPDMGFGFVKAIKPFNLAALSFTVLHFIHLTLWSFCGWIPLLLTGTLLGASSIAMIITADKGIKKWTL